MTKINISTAASDWHISYLEPGSTHIGVYWNVVGDTTYLYRLSYETIDAVSRVTFMKIKKSDGNAEKVYITDSSSDWMTILDLHITGAGEIYGTMRWYASPIPIIFIYSVSSDTFSNFYGTDFLYRTFHPSTSSSK
jgi:hypothetical protein